MTCRKVFDPSVVRAAVARRRRNLRAALARAEQRNDGKTITHIFNLLSPKDDA